MRNTIKNVIMVVPVLMTSCQVSEKWNNGPVAPQTITKLAAIENAEVEPENFVMAPAKRPKNEPEVGVSIIKMSAVKYAPRKNWTNT